ncbi:DnaJ-domain-containing protein [Panus rudis PR-1116 ss-1]|nr:DnaJ-domain-containing protein [Panus rudis PR-1116 ss-1]
MATVLTSLIGWTFLPDFASRQLLPYFHRGYTSVTSRPAPPPGTPQYARHYRNVYAFVVLSYLLYNFVQAAFSLEPNYYEILGVPPNADEATLKVAFRQFAKRNHPDRVGPEGETLFIQVRDAFEALKNPTTRLAYDRFGPDALTWTHCKSVREYINHGLTFSAGFHIFSLCGLVLLSFVGKPSPVAYWRYVLYIFFAAYELSFIMSPSQSPPSAENSIFQFVFSNPSQYATNGILGVLWPYRVPYQHIRFLHSLSVLLSIALTRVAPVLFPPPVDETLDLAWIRTQLVHLEKAARNTLDEANNITSMELHSVHGEATGTKPTDATFPAVPLLNQPAEPVVDLLTTEIERIIIEGRLAKADWPVKSVIDVAVDRERKEREKLGHGERERSPVYSSPTKPSTPRRMVVGARRPLGSPAPSFGPGIPQGYVRGRSQSC